MWEESGLDEVWRFLKGKGDISMKERWRAMPFGGIIMNSSCSAKFNFTRIDVLLFS